VARVIFHSNHRRVDCGKCTWVPLGELREIRRRAKKAECWGNGNFVSTVVLKRYQKGERWFRYLWEPPETIAALLRDLQRQDLGTNVSSWAAVWRMWGIFPPAVDPDSGFGRMLAAAEQNWVTAPYAWIEQRLHGPQPGAWREWDLNSAYAWASMRGLPDPRTFRRAPKDVISDQAIYLATGVESTWGDSEPPILPPWLRPQQRRRIFRDGLFSPKGRKHPRPAWWIPGECLNRLSLRPKGVIAAFEWRRDRDLGPVFAEIKKKLPRWWKSVFRAHWGEWASTEVGTRQFWVDGRLDHYCSMPSGHAAPVWSWLILSRVADRMSGYADHAARIFVDSVVLPAELEPENSGAEVGEWKVSNEWDSGVTILPLPRRPLPGIMAPKQKQERHGDDGA
jgi:hypothetical protein